MKKFYLFSIVCGIAVSILTSCRSKEYMEAFTPEESGMHLMKITDESHYVMKGSVFEKYPSNFASSYIGGNRREGIAWNTTKVLDVSPDGQYIAFMSLIDGNQNILTHRSVTGGVSSPRTYSNVNSLCWGFDDRLYYGDLTERMFHGQMCSTGAKAGTSVRRITNGYDDHDPVITRDGKLMFFTRVDAGGSTIYSYNLENGELNMICKGYNPAIVGRSHDSFVCTKNSSNGNSEIWYVNYAMNREECILSSPTRSFTNPNVSPDGKWIVCQANSTSPINKAKNLDIFVAKLDGSNMMQLTYHPCNDFCPVWGPDGKTIYFVSARANSDKRYNIWSMRFTGM